MTDTLDHIICGGIGKLLGWIRIWIKDHVVLNAAVNLKHEALVEKYGATEDEALEFGAMIQADVRKWYQHAKDKWGVPYHYYKPHPANLKQKPRKLKAA